MVNYHVAHMGTRDMIKYNPKLQHLFIMNKIQKYIKYIPVLQLLIVKL